MERKFLPISQDWLIQKLPESSTRMVFLVDLTRSMMQSCLRYLQLHLADILQLLKFE